LSKGNIEHEEEEKEMFDVKKIIEEITSKKEIKNVSFAGVGGSLASNYAAFYYLTREAKQLTTSYTSANEFVHDTPTCVGENSIVVISSRGGNTAETVEAGRVAKKLGATVIGLTHEEGVNGISEVSDYTIVFEDGDDVAFEVGKPAYTMKIAYETLHAVEGNDKYEAMVAAMNKMNELVPAAKKAVVPEAIKFSINYKDDNVIYTMGSGTSWSAAQQQTICILMEMQWINSAVIHTGEFFHGPFEITDPNTAFLLLKSTGKTKPLDERAITFLDQYNHHHTVVDLEKYGAKELGEVSEYFDYDFHTALLDVFNHLLADMRDHPLSKRKYMWKYKY